MTGQARDLIARAGHVHVMGSAFAIPGIAPIILEAVSVVKARGGTVSFDPNVRKELMSGGGEAKRQFDSVLDVTDLLLPSGEELSIATGVDGEVLAIESLLARGISRGRLEAGAAGVFTLQPQPRGGRLSGIRGRGNRPDGGRRTALEQPISPAAARGTRRSRHCATPMPPGPATSPGKVRWRARPLLRNSTLS